MKNSIKKSPLGILMCLAIIFVLVVLASVPVFASETVFVNGSNVNVRSQPDTQSSSLGKLQKGTELQRIEKRSDGWSSVDYKGKTAYIRSDLLSTSMNSKTKSQSDKTVCSYIGNANSMKFHKPTCGSIKKMKESNKVFFTETRNDIINMGYKPCGNCKP